ncbi:MAG: EscV/YscV/HrcV family type III secretion system export apparatus protein [Planctomycetota bacterium]|nr:MAG: EscV/YscV/HrcV family type III secretion system export apparatus protein [Planctomycetota bacterium]
MSDRMAMLLAERRRHCQREPGSRCAARACPRILGATAGQPVRRGARALGSDMAEAGGQGFFDRYDFQTLIGRYADVLLAAVVLAILGIMLVPLPPPLLDVLLTSSITFSMLLLLTALYLPEPVALSSFPTLLLVVTLFRLSLSIASTRLILADAYAGEVIEAFGNFVARGNMVVGFVVFAIITVVQFLVIAKGSERISEVAARFTLDAMPGKQMSIDADLRAGAFDIDTARKKRLKLQKESQFYGSMDGAMKFVKGDTIAGIIIIFVNVIGGLVIGVTMKGMDVAKAAQVYTILTIGDGLVAQVSALLTSVSAGMVTTRVISEQEGDVNLGREIATQLTAHPKAFLIASGFLALLGVATPLPTIPFLMIAGVVGTLGFGLQHAVQRREEPGLAGAATEEEPEGEVQATAHPVPVVLELAPEFTSMIDTSKPEGREFFKTLQQVRNELYRELGVQFPGVRVRGNRPLGEGGWCVRIFDVPLFRGAIPPGFGFVRAPAEQFAALGAEVRPVQDPISGRQACFVPLEYADRVADMGASMMGPDHYVLTELGVALKRHAADFLGIQEVQALIDEVGRSIPALLKEVVPKLVPMTSLTEVLQRLVQEEISIRDMRAILQSLARWAQVEKDPATLAEYVRSDLKQQISFKFSGGGRELNVYLLEPQIEQAIRGAIQRTAQGSYLALDPDMARRILAAARKSLADLPSTASRPVILTAVDVRRYLKKLLELDLPQVVVLSYQEISPLLTVQPIGRISLAGVGR